MSALDVSIVNIAMPLIARDFHLPPATVEWVAMAYLLVAAVLLLSFGRLGDMIGHKKIFVLGFVLFTLSSVGAGMAPGIAVLLAARVIQGIGGSMLWATGPAILTLAFPAEKRGQALGMQGLFTYLGLTTGPALGGFLASLFTWRAIFFINLPVGIIAFILAGKVIPESHSTKRERFDFAGAAVFCIGLFSILLVLNRGPAWGWTLPTLALIAVSLASGPAFLWIETRVPTPMLHLALFRQRLFTVGVISSLLSYTVNFIIIFLLPFYLLAYRHFSPDRAGVILTAMSVVMALVAPVAGSVSDRIGSRVLASGGMGILGLAAGLFSSLSAHTPLPQILCFLALAGLGLGTFVSPNNSAIMGAASADRRGIAAGVLALSRNTGMALGVAVGGYFLTALGGSPKMGRIVSSSGFPVAFHWAMLTAAGLAVTGAALSLARGDTLHAR